ncbi:NAD-binding protein [Pseudomonadota bacterium]
MSFAKLLVQRCYVLEDSLRYRRIKQFFYDLLENPHAPVRPYFDLGMIVLVLTSVFLLIYAVKNDLGWFGDVFERVAVTIFLLEYLARLWLYSDSHKVIIEHYERSEFINAPFQLWTALQEVMRKKWDYMITPLALIDLLAIIPSYRPLRFLRIFLLFRLFKLFRYSRSINQFARVLSEKRFEFLVLFFFLVFVVFTAASAIYFFEARSEGGDIDSFFDGIYWAVVTVSTVGYGDITPQTAEGRFVTLMLIMCGFGVIAFTTSIIVSAFSEKMPEIRRNRAFSEIEKRNNHTVLCGFGRIGQVVAERLYADREHFVVVDPDRENINLARQHGYLAIEGNAESVELLQNIGVAERAQRILCLTDDDVINVYITLTARHMNPDIEIISRANKEETASKLVQAGANHTVLPYKIVALVAGEYAGQPVAFEAIRGILTGGSELGMDTIPVHENSSLNGRSLGSINFCHQKLTLFGVIGRSDRKHHEIDQTYDLKTSRFLFNPGPELVLQAGDFLVVFGHQLSIVHFRDCLERGKI